MISNRYIQVAHIKRSFETRAQMAAPK